MLAHILLSGRPLCGRAGTPNTWPDDEAFIAYPDVPYAKGTIKEEFNYCETCKRMYDNGNSSKKEKKS